MLSAAASLGCPLLTPAEASAILGEEAVLRASSDQTRATHCVYAGPSRTLTARLNLFGSEPAAMAEFDRMKKDRGGREVKLAEGAFRTLDADRGGLVALKGGVVLDFRVQGPEAAGDAVQQRVQSFAKKLLSKKR